MSTTTSFTVHSAVIHGIEARPVGVAATIDRAAAPRLSVEGVADACALEMGRRVRCAIRSCGYELPRAGVRVTVSPVEVRKGGAGLDLPAAVAVLAASGQIPTDGLDAFMFVGELGLEGGVRAVRGELAHLDAARDAGLTLVCGAAESSPEADGAGRIRSLSDLRAGVGAALRPFGCGLEEGVSAPLDFADVEGFASAKRALAVACAGGLGVLLVGGPGTPRAALARRVPTIMGEPDAATAHEVAVIHSVAGEAVDGGRPFRAPHRTVSAAGLVGGGRPVLPGEASLAHGGVLFLDDLGEWPACTLQRLASPAGEGRVRIVRADGAYEFPARFMLVAASDSPLRGPSSGPLGGLLDVRVDLSREDGGEGLCSAELRALVERGRALRELRCGTDVPVGAGSGDVLEGLAVAPDGRGELLGAARRGRLGEDGAARLARVARAVADVEGSAEVGRAHVLGALRIANI